MCQISWFLLLASFLLNYFSLAVELLNVLVKYVDVGFHRKLSAHLITVILLLQQPTKVSEVLGEVLSFIEEVQNQGSRAWLLIMEMIVIMTLKKR